MNQRRKLWIGLGGTGAVLALLVMAPMLIDWSAFKPQIVQAVREATGRDVQVAGPLRLHLLPSPRLVASDVSIGGLGDAPQPLLTARKLAAAVELMPLLRRQVSVRYVVIDEPVITLMIYPDGSNNWAQVGQEPAQPSTTKIAIHDFQIKNGTLVYQGADQGAGDATRLEDIDLKLGIESLDGPFQVDGSLAYKAVPLALAARVDAKGLLESTLTLADGAGTIALNGRMPKNGQPMALMLDAAAPNLSKLLEALPRDDKEKTEASPPSPAMQSAFSLKGKLVSAEEFHHLTGTTFTLGKTRGSLDLTYRSGEPISRLTGAVALAFLDLQAFQSPDEEDKDKPSRFPYPLDLPRTLEADVTLSIASAQWEQVKLSDVTVPVSLRQGVIDLPRLALALPGDTQASGRARIASVEGFADVDAAFNLTSGSLPALLRAAAIEPPLAGMGGGGASGRLRLSGSVLTLDDLAVKALGSSGSGTVTMKLGGPKPAMAVSMAFDQVDMARLTPVPAKASDAKAKPAAIPDTDFRLSIRRLLNGATTLSSITASGRLADGTLALTQARIGDVNGASLLATGTIRNVLEDKRETDLALTVSADKLNGAAQVKGPMSKLEVALKGNLAGAAITGDGWVDAAATQPRLAFQASVTALEAARVFAALADTPSSSPIKPLGALKGTATLSGAGSLIKLEPLSLAIGKTAVTGKASIDTSRAVPVVTAALNAGRLDLTAFAGDTSAAAASQDPDQRWSREPLPLDMIRSIDGSITIAAEQILYAGYNLADVRLRLAFPGQRASIEQFDARLFGGSLSAKGALDAAGATPRLTATLALAGVPLDSLMKTFSGTDPATGTLRFNTSLNASGASQYALVSSLAGAGQFAAENGVIRKVDIKAVNDKMKSLRTVNDFVRLTGTALKGGETRYRSLSTGLDIRQGVVKLVDAKSDMDGGDVTASGTVNLPDWEMNIAGKFLLQDHADAPPIGFGVRGPIGQTKNNYDLAGLQKFFATRIAAAGLRAVVDKQGYDPRDLIGGKNADGTRKSTSKAALDAVVGAVGKSKHSAEPTATQTQNQAQNQAAATPRSAEDDVKDLVTRGIGGLFGKKKSQPAEEEPPAEPQPQP